MRGLPLDGVRELALVGAHCDDIALGAGATLLTLARSAPGLRVRALVLTGAGTEREAEERAALDALLPGADLQVEVLGLPDTRLPAVWGEVKDALGAFARSCEPGLVLGPGRHDAHQDHRLVAELLPTCFRDHLHLAYEILKWESDLPRPSVLVPVGDDAVEAKLAALAEHYPSQAGRSWFDEDAFRALLRLRGVQCQRRWAEGFTTDKLVLAAGTGEDA